MYPLIPGSAFKCVHVGVTVYSIQRASVEVEVFECVHLLPQSVNGGFVFGLCVCVRVRVRVCVRVRVYVRTLCLGKKKTTTISKECTTIPTRSPHMHYSAKKHENF